MYKQLIRPILFRFTPERIHDIIMLVFRFLSYIPLSKAFLSIFNNSNSNKLGKTLWNINFPHPVGLAAGLDKNAEAFEMFGSLGFSFIEIGTVTPKAQSGNSKPRLFRLPKSLALINRMGFNNEGVDKVVKRLKKHSSNLIIGGNIGKNKLTPNELAVDDYVFSFRALSEHVDYIAINISSPNTPGLRELQHKEELNTLLGALNAERESLNIQIPILVKIAPDLTKNQIDDVLEAISISKMDGIIATNTTIDRFGLKSYSKTYVEEIGSGGLSGKPLTDRSTEVIKYISIKTNGNLPIIGVGGIMTAQDAKDKLDAGASLVQLYTGFIYEGPNLIKQINKLLLQV